MKYILFKSLLLGALAISCNTSNVSSVPSIKDEIKIDGIFGEKEWNRAKKIRITPDNFLYLMQNNDYIFIGVQNKERTRRYVDLYIASNSKEIVNFHVSMQLGERLLTDNWNDTIPSWNWGNHNGWKSNKVEILNRDEGISFIERLKPYQGQEFQISKGKIGRKQFKIRLEIKDFVEQASEIIFPINSHRRRTDDWLLMRLY